MLLSRTYINAFCEIKNADTNSLLSTGYVDEIKDDSITIRNCLFIASGKKLIISIINQNRGLKVFNATSGDMSSDKLNIFDFSKITDVERRGSLRIPVNLPVSVLIVSNKNIYNALLVDISNKGVAFWIDYDIALDDNVLIQFSLDNKLCNCVCNIVRNIGSNKTSPKKYGCCFLRNKISKETLSIIQSYIFKKQAEVLQAQLFHK